MCPLQKSNTICVFLDETKDMNRLVEEYSLYSDVIYVSGTSKLVTNSSLHIDKGLQILYGPRNVASVVLSSHNSITIKATK